MVFQIHALLFVVSMIVLSLYGLELEDTNDDFDALDNLDLVTLFVAYWSAFYSIIVVFSILLSQLINF